MSLSIVLFSLYIYWYSNGGGREIPFQYKEYSLLFRSEKEYCLNNCFHSFPCFENDSYIEPMIPKFSTIYISNSSTFFCDSFWGIIPDLLILWYHIFLKIFLFINGYARSFLFWGCVKSKGSYRSSMNCSTSTLLVGA